MRMPFPLLLALLLLTSCNGNKTFNGKDGESEDSVFMLDGPGSVYEPTEAELGEYALETIQEVYAAVAEAYKSADWQENSAKLDKKYCSKDWNATVEAVEEKDAHREGEIGFFDADYWVMGQDFDEQNLHASNFVLKKVTKDLFPWRASVSLTLHNFSDIPVNVDLVYEDGYWKVDNLTDLKYDLNWKGAMKEYLAE